MRKAVLDRGERQPLLSTLKHRAARLSRPPQARRCRCLDNLVELCYMVRHPTRKVIDPKKKQCYEVAKLLSMKNAKLYYNKPARPNLKEEIKDMGKGEIAFSKKINIIKLNFKAMYGDGLIIIFCRDSNEVETVYKMLHNDYGNKITYTHNRLNAKQRTANEFDSIRNCCRNTCIWLWYG